MAATVYTLTCTGKRNLGGGALIAYGTITGDTGDYATGGIAPSPTFASLDQISNREPSVVLFDAAGGYMYSYDRDNGLLKAYAQNDSGATTYNDTQLSEKAASAAVASTVNWVAFWFPRVP